MLEDKMKERDGSYGCHLHQNKTSRWRREESSSRLDEAEGLKDEKVKKSDLQAQKGKKTTQGSIRLRA